MTPILLMGLRGSGKSTAGDALAREFERPFVDLDDATLAWMGFPNVREAWESAGEAAFRTAELEALRGALAQTPGAVIALGGGTPTVEGFEELSAGTRRYYLHASPAALRARLRENDENRPALTANSALDEIEEVYRVRDRLYRRVAHEVIDAEGTPEQTLRALARQAASE